MSKRFRFGVDVLLPIGLVLLTIWPVILVGIGCLLVHMYPDHMDPGTAMVNVKKPIILWGVDLSWLANFPSGSPFQWGCLSLTSGFLGFSFYWACRDRDRKRKRLRFVFRVLMPIAILVWTISPCLTGLLGQWLIDIFGDHPAEEIENAGMPQLFLFFTVPTGVVALLIWVVVIAVWLVHKKKLDRTSSP